jgi:hypothetical protein
MRPLLAFLLVALAGCREGGQGTTSTGTTTTTSEPPRRSVSGNERVTLETFKKVQIGMTYDAVQELLGDQGKSSWERGAPKAFGRYWLGRKDMAGDPTGPDPRIDVDFADNKVTDRRATNLK